MKSVSLQAARSPLVLALDIGTSSVRALLFDADARQVETTESQTTWQLDATADGGLTADARDLVDLVCKTIDQTLDQSSSRTADIAGVGCSSFWHSLLALNDAHEPIGPLYMWIDNRSHTDANALREHEDLARRMRSETGCRPHSSYWPAKLVWLARTNQQLFRQSRHWVSFTDYLGFRLNGRLATSVCMASGTGLLNIQTSTWHESISGRFGIDIATLPQLMDRLDPCPALSDEYRQRWPALADAPWYPALGDGAAANVGSGCVGTDRIAMTIGTSAAMRLIVPSDAIAETTPTPLWEYRLDRSHHVIGGALSNGGNVTRWIADVMADGNIEGLSGEAKNITAPDSHGLTWLPFFAGERSPSWNDEAFGSLLGLRFSTTRAEIFRAALEGTAYRLAAVYDQLKLIANPVHEIHANGGAALNSPLWMSIIADTFGQRLDAMDADAEVSARGAAVSVLNAIGELPDLRPAKIESSETYQPEPKHFPLYQRARHRQTAYESAIDKVQAQNHYQEP
ncbi:MAG: gluconokinase [Thermomicrobiales bacterium]